MFSHVINIAFLLLGTTGCDVKTSPFPSSVIKWDVYERLHDHMSVFNGVVRAKTEAEALREAKRKYGQKITHVVPYSREGFVAPLSDYDLGCYRN